MKNLADRKCIILGGGGFLGTALCNKLHGRVKSLRVFDQNFLYKTELDGAELYSGDFFDVEDLTKAISGFDTVVHLINTSTPASANADKIGDIEKNLIPTIHLLDVCRSLKVQQVIFASSGGTVYGIPEVIPTPEIAPTNPITAYGVAKLAIENYLSLYNYLYGLDYKVLRIANPYGPYQQANKGQGVIAAFVQKALAMEQIEIWGNGEIVRDYIYIDDVVEAFIHAIIYNGDQHIFNIGTGKGYSLNAIVELLRKTLHLDIPIEYKHGRIEDVPSNILDVSLAAKELMWQAKTYLQDGLQLTTEWNIQQRGRNIQ